MQQLSIEAVSYSVASINRRTILSVTSEDAFGLVFVEKMCRHEIDMTACELPPHGGIEQFRTMGAASCRPAHICLYTVARRREQEPVPRKKVAVEALEYFFDEVRMEEQSIDEKELHDYVHGL